MKYSFFLLLLLACQDYNSNSADKQRYGLIELENEPQFRAAYNIIQNRCVNCHTSQIHSVWSTYTTNAAWIESGRVDPGSPQDSTLIKRIINSGETNSNMPIGGSAIPNDEYDALVEWVQNLP